MELIVVRHAEPVRVEEGSVDGAADPALSPAGRVASRSGSPTGWPATSPTWCSPARCGGPGRRRRRSPARLGVAVEIVADLVEYDADADEYIPIEELRATKDERWYATIEGRWSDVGGVDPREFQRQVVPTFEAVIDRFAGRRVVVFTHGGVLNVYLASVLGIDAPLWFDPEYTSVHRVQAARTGQRSVATLNETAHLYARRDPTPKDVP